jgi:hypothetical protein
LEADKILTIHGLIDLKQDSEPFAPLSLRRVFGRHFFVEKGEIGAG